MIPALNRRGLDMTRFVQGADRGQSTLLPEFLDDWVADDNPVRVIDAFVAALDLAELRLGGVEPARTGRPSYHPAALLRLYIYGYLNRVHSSRRLEREAGRNVEVMWLLARLAPDHKTIADFRKDNGPGIKKVCARFVEVCRKMGLLATASVAIDGSKFKAVNNRDKNFTRGKVERRRTQLEESVARYLAQLDTADRQEPSETLELKKTRIKERLENLAVEIAKLAAIEKQVLASPDQQISFTDPDSRSMATSGRCSGVVGYNVQTAVDTESHLIVAHEVTTSGSDRSQLANMARQAKAVLEADTLDVVADRGYFKGEEILACEQSGITVTLPKPMTSGAKASGRFGNRTLLICQTRMFIAARPVRNSNIIIPTRKTARSCATIGRTLAKPVHSNRSARRARNAVSSDGCTRTSLNALRRGSTRIQTRCAHASPNQCRLSRSCERKSAKSIGNLVCNRA